MSGTVAGWFYRPGITSVGRKLAKGVIASTNRFGDIALRRGMSDAESLKALNHAKVHEFLSRKFTFLKKLRADIGMFAYSQSHLLRRAEDGLAAAWAHHNDKGLTGIWSAWKEPMKRGSGINTKRVAFERKVIVGIAANSAAAGFAHGSALDEHLKVQKGTRSATNGM